jgi:hypothetical protein
LTKLVTVQKCKSIFFYDIFTGEHNEKVLSRCKSRLVIVCNEKVVKRFIEKDHYSSEYALKITVSGKKELCKLPCQKIYHYMNNLG